MRMDYFSPAVSLAVLLFFATGASAAWQRIDVDRDLIESLFAAEDVIGHENRPGFVDDKGIERYPGCSEAPVVFDPSGQPLEAPVTGSGDFAFFVDLGDEEESVNDLLIYFAGGGACWDAATCVGSALTPLPTYFPSFSETEDQLEAASADDDGSGAGGILTRMRPDNPYASFGKVYIPYCTGDVHVGSSDTTYDFPLLPSWEIRHRGFDNLLVVLKWLQNQQLNGLELNGALTVSGSSAGGYGALINFPVIREALGENPDYSIIVDSANGVLTNGFLNQAFGPPGGEGVWGAKQNFGDTVRTVLDQEDASSLWVSMFAAIGGEYRDTRISQSTAAYDAVQALVLLFMHQVDQGTYNPFTPPTEEAITLTALFDWSPKARAAMLTTSLNVWNYKKYLGAGSGHIHLIDPPPNVVNFPTTNYFQEDSARNVAYVNWLDDMLNNPRLFFRTDWRNLSCFPNCLE